MHPRLFFPYFFIACMVSMTAHAQTVVYNYPASNSTGVNAKTTIGVRYSEMLVKSLLTSKAFTVTGSSSGLHSGKVTLAVDGRTVIFTPDKYFTSGERVVATISALKCLLGKFTPRYSFKFTIAKTK